MKLKVTQIKSVIGRKQDHRRTVRALGLHRISESVLHDDSPQVRGMIAKVQYLLEVEEVSASGSKE